LHKILRNLQERRASFAARLRALDALRADLKKAQKQGDKGLIAQLKQKIAQESERLGLKS